MGTFLTVILGVILIALVAGFVIWLVSKLGLGLEVDSFLYAVVAALVISGIGQGLNYLIGLVWTIPGGWFGAIINLIVATIVLILSDRVLKSFKVNGFGGALLAAVAIGIVTWIIQWLIGLLV